MTTPEKISVIIPTKNAGPNFAELLRRLASQKTNAPLELFIIDSSSTDNTIALAKQANAKTQVIPQKSFNHGQTRNLAISQTTGDPIILLSQDALPANDHLLQNLARNFSDPTVAAVYARHIPYPHHRPLIRHYVEQFNSHPDRRESQIQNPAAYHALSPFERFTLCRFDNVCSAIRRSVWQAHPFAPRTFAEDLEWSQRILLYKAGDGIAGVDGVGGGHVPNKIIYDPSALVLHSHNHSLAQHYRRVQQTHRALHELFNLALIPTRRQIPPQFLRSLRRNAHAILHSTGPITPKIQDLLALPLRTLLTLLATYHGPRHASSHPPLPTFTCPLNPASTQPHAPFP